MALNTEPMKRYMLKHASAKYITAEVFEIEWENGKPTDRPTLNVAYAYANAFMSDDGYLESTENQLKILNKCGYTKYSPASLKAYEKAEKYGLYAKAASTIAKDCENLTAHAIYEIAKDYVAKVSARNKARKSVKKVTKKRK